MSTVIVTGIRDSEAESLALKKDAASHIEVVTAEDIGKLPAKNVADTLQRLPGVNISSSSAVEGGFDESDRVSLRGTSPSLTQTLVNGHNVGTGDWFVLSQVQTVGRSVSYSLLPAEIVSQVVVHKTSEASIVEGGSAGSVDIITRKPLEFAKPVTAEASVGGVYADLPGNTKPQFSGLFNWKNDANTFGVTGAGVLREAQPAAQRSGSGRRLYQICRPMRSAGPSRSGRRVLPAARSVRRCSPRSATARAAAIDLQFKPTDNLTLDLNGFYSKLKADNYNRNYMLWASSSCSGGRPAARLFVKNNVLTNATFARCRQHHLWRIRPDLASWRGVPSPSILTSMRTGRPPITSPSTARSAPPVAPAPARHRT